MVHVLFLVLLFAVAAHSFAIQAKTGNSRGLTNLHTAREASRGRALYLSTVAADAKPKKKGGEATIATSTFNLAKSIVGAGVLSLPSGIAFFADEPAAIIPASLMCAIMGIVSAYSFNLIGKACEQHDATSFQDVWAKSVNPKSAWMISASITAMCFLASLAYSIIIGDSFTALARTFNLPVALASRNNLILAITGLVLLPLCSLKSLNSLAPFSLLGLGGTLYTAIVMAIRYFDGTYAKGGKFFEAMAVAARPSFYKRGGFSVNHLTFVLLSMLSTSYIAHYNAPQFFNELKDTSLPRFNKMVNGAFGISIALFIFMMGTGFLTFGGATAGFVLNNYASSDALITFARLAIGLALLTGYPFTFSALRDGILDLQGAKGEARDKAFKPLTFGLLACVTALALFLKDVGFVVSVSGAMFGSALMFMVPAYMNICNTKNLAAKTNKPITGNTKLEILFNYGMIVTGFVMGALGVVISTMRQFGKL